QRFGKCDPLETFRVRVGVRIAIVYSIDLSRFQNDIGPNLACAQRRRGVGRKIRIAGAGRENHHSPKFEMSNGATENEWLGHVFHLDLRLDMRFDASYFYRFVSYGCAWHEKQID